MAKPNGKIRDGGRREYRYASTVSFTVILRREKCIK